MEAIVAGLGLLWLILLIVVVVAWLSCPFIGYAQGSKTGNAWYGFTFGLVFGPLGVLVAIAHRIAVDTDIQAQEIIDYIESREVGREGRR